MEKGQTWLRDRWFFLQGFFPWRLFLLHLRRSHLLVLFWLFLFALVSGSLGRDYGLPYLFVSPEYQGEVGFLSYFFLGLSAGLFTTMAFHINSYIYYSYRFPFLATLQRPLWKFSINNSLIPLIFIAFLLWEVSNYLVAQGYSFLSLLGNIAGLLLGLSAMIGFTLGYFVGTIRSLQDRTAANRPPVANWWERVRSRRRKPQNLGHGVHFYLKNFVQVRLTRSVQHYDSERLRATIEQHHLSATFFFLLLILLTVGLSLLSSLPFFRIPAGASIFLICSLYLMIVGAIYVRFKTWTVSLGVVVLLAANYLSGWDIFQQKHYAYGLNYHPAKAAYRYASLDSLTRPEIVERDHQDGEQRLNRWRAQWPDTVRPELLILNVSGGGMRSALWTFRILQHLDSLSAGVLYPHLHLITGSSGGMLGAAYYRELKYQKSLGSEIEPNHRRHAEQLTEDLLNPTAFSLAVNDLFFRMRKVNVGGQQYPLDRGYTFDRNLSENTIGLLDYRLAFRRKQEELAQVPMLLLAPTIVGDGRKLLISPLDLSYLTFNPLPAGLGKTKEYDAVDFRALFSRHQADSLSFLTALRLSASFPYITPLVHMPSKPEIRLIDAGVRDNEGLEMALRFMEAHADWLAANTRGVRIVQIKANRPDQQEMFTVPNTRLSELSLPISGVVRSFGQLQIYNKALLLNLANERFDFPLAFDRFTLLESRDAVSLSWHLTPEEKRAVEERLYRYDNWQALEKLAVSYKKKAGHSRTE